MAHTVSLRRIGDAETSFVIRNFEEFYTEIIRLKQRILDGTWVPMASTLDQVPADSDQSDWQGASAINNKLMQILERQVLDASERGGEFATSYYREAQYIMAALADEVFLNFEWKGRKFWEDNLLESRLFGSHDAGDVFFKRLEKFLANRDPIRRDLAEVYLLALGLGFEGKYRGTSNHERIAYYRKNLYIFINHRELKFFEEHERVFPEAYVYILDQGDRKMMQDKRLWYSAFLIACVITFGFSELMWRHAINPIAETIDSIKKEALK